MSFKKFETKVNIPKREEEIIEFWKRNSIFEKSITQRDPENRFVFYEGPPTANGKPGVHHGLSRSFKDCVCRYKAMRGYYVERKGGWDTHGLPVEIEVEKRLGLKNKKDIERYGIEKFIKQCKESVFKYKREWERMTERIAFWLDMDNAYITYENYYIETLWWIIKEISKKGLLYKDYKVVPYCPRCGTPLSSHEVAQGYKEVYDPSVFVKFRIPSIERTFFLVWTTTPWTLPSNMLLAVNRDFIYAKVLHDGEYFVLAKERLNEVFKDKEYEVVEEFKGERLIDIDYEPLFDFVNIEKRFHFVTHGDFVSLEEGTGIVHIAPGYGADDLELGKKYNLPVIQLVGEDGKFKEEAKPLKGMWAKDADKFIIKNLKERGLLFKEERCLHSYPHCWRCDTPLLYFAKSSWFIKTTAVKENLIKNNEKINWYPVHIKKGRFGNWLETLVDWAISRERYWGTPLPVWKCKECGYTHVVGSIEELKNMAIEMSQNLELHRPYVDEVKLKCPECGGEMEREKEVIDVWFDSGAMPYAQFHYPFENREKFKKNFPADYVCEAIDQTRGWFFTLHILGTLLFDSPAFKNVLCLELVLDEKGEKMSKHKGNIVDPWEVLNNEGADAFRWYLFTVSPPWLPRRFSREMVEVSLRNFIIPLRSSASFFTLYANIDNFSLNKFTQPPLKNRSLIDRWIISRLNSLIKFLIEKLEEYNLTEATRRMERFTSELTNWYIRLNRKRFWKGKMDEDKISAYFTLYEVLKKLSILIAPFAPFISEEIYQAIVVPEDEFARESVHLEDYPEPDENLIDEELEERMVFTKTIVELGRSARKRSKIKVRQPLRKILVFAKERKDIEDFKDIILSELNIKEIEFRNDEENFVSYTLKPNHRLLGEKLGRALKDFTDLLKDNPEKVLSELDKKGYIEAETSDGKKKITADELIIEKKPKGNYSIGWEKGITVLLSLDIDEELKKEGWLREFLHFVQNSRKKAGLEVTDRIILGVSLPEDKKEIVKSNEEFIKSEVLVDKLVFEIIEDGFTEKFEEGEVSIRKVD